MNDDVKAAVERLVEWERVRSTDERHGHIYASLANGGSCHYADEQKVLGHVIAQHRLDSVPLTEAVLRASGWQYSRHNETWWRVDIPLSLKLVDDVLCLWPSFVGCMTTAGDLQRLCDALHLGVAVVVPESEVVE